MIAVVECGIGNLGSVTRGLRRAGAEVLLTGDPEDLRRADAVVLPGDGAFGATMAGLEARGLVPALREAVAGGRPLLGICVGMQVLFEAGEEHGLHRGLGVLPGVVRRLPGEVALPHVGWNRLRLRRDHPLLAGVPDGAHVYFVHSYFCDAPDELVAAVSDHGREFPAVVGRGSVVGVQFHPEKSQGVGGRVLAAFVRMAGQPGRAA